MFYLLSKLLYFFLTPIIWIFVLLLVAFFSKRDELQRRSLILALILFYVFSNSFLFSEAVRKWEIPAKSVNTLNGTYDVGIVLGGILFYDSKLDRIQFFKGNDRLMQALELYKKGKIKKILFAGGSGSLTYPDFKEGKFVRQFLLTLGIPADDVIIESESNNTYENVLFSKPILLQKFPSGKYLLVTSAIHMKRAEAIFKKQGISVDTYSADRYTGDERRFTLDMMLLPDALTLASWNSFVHELAGYCVYRLMGYL